MTVHKVRKSCRVCGGHDLDCFLSLGPMPLANSFLRSPDDFADELFFPLDVYFCHQCTTVQLLDVIDPEVLFRHYLYVTGTSDTIAAHNRRYARTVVDLLKMGADDLVVEIASNDGSLLRCFQDEGVRTLGIDPASNIADIARKNGVETIDRFFDSVLSAEVRDKYGTAKAVVGNNVLAHVDDTRDFLAGFKNLTTEDGLVIIEMPYLRNLLRGLEYDTIYHEHLCYFSVNSLIHLCDAVGLVITRIDNVPVHGGSLRMYAGRDTHYGCHAAEILEWAERERAEGMTSFERFQHFAAEVDDSRKDLLEILGSLKRSGKSVAGYGASAKGTTLLNYCGIDTGLLDYTVDKNPLKVDLYTPGTHIPVLPVAVLAERQPDYLLILAWNFADEIMQQQQSFAERGGRFIVPIPELQVI